MSVRSIMPSLNPTSQAAQSDAAPHNESVPGASIRPVTQRKRGRQRPDHRKKQRQRGKNEEGLQERRRIGSLFAGPAPDGIGYTTRVFDSR